MECVQVQNSRVRLITILEYFGIFYLYYIYVTCHQHHSCRVCIIFTAPHHYADITGGGNQRIQSPHYSLCHWARRESCAVCSTQYLLTTAQVHYKSSLLSLNSKQLYQQIIITLEQNRYKILKCKIFQTDAVFSSAKMSALCCCRPDARPQNHHSYHQLALLSTSQHCLAPASAPSHHRLAEAAVVLSSRGLATAGYRGPAAPSTGGGPGSDHHNKHIACGDTGDSALPGPWSSIYIFTVYGIMAIGLQTEPSRGYNPRFKFQRVHV